MLKLSDVKVGKPRSPTAWSNELQKNVEINYKDKFVNTVKESNHKHTPKEDWDRYKSRLNTIELSDDTLISKADHYHTNYLNYLEKCWADHLGVVITPDIVWYTILCEFSSLVKSDPEPYRPIFTDSPDKKSITIPSGSMTTMPLDVLTNALRGVVPTDTSIFFPKFHAHTTNSAHVFLAAFCDICSPYYNYMMYACGFPCIDVRGSLDDWKMLREQWTELKKIMVNDKWTKAVDDVLRNIVLDFNNVELWKNMLKIERCGSGHQTELLGWFTDLFREQPSTRYAENFSSHISNIKYRQLDTEKDFEMSVGLFNSVLIGDCLEPSFSFLVYDVSDDKKTLGEKLETVIENAVSVFLPASRD